MPVSTRVRGGVLVLTVDGDYTANELRRISFGAFEAEGTPSPAPVLLDMSGAAGLADKSQQELEATGAIFGAYRDRVSGIAVVASPEVFDLFDHQSPFASEAGVSVQAYQSHDDARAWLLSGGS